MGGLVAPVRRPRSYQSVIIYCVSHPTCVLEVSKLSKFLCLPVLRPRSYQSVAILLLFPRDLRPRSYQSVATSFPPVLRLRSYECVVIYCFFHPTCALEVTKVSPLSFSFPACALEVTKVSPCIVFPADLRPRSYQRVSYFRVPFLSCALEVTKVFLFSFSLPDLRPQGHQSFPSFVPSSRLAPSKLPKCHCFMVVSTGLAPSKSRSFRVPSSLRRYQNAAVHRFVHPNCALKVTKVS